MLHRALYEFLEIKVSKNTQYAKVNSGECNLLYKFMHKLCVSCRLKQMNLTFLKKNKVHVCKAGKSQTRKADRP